MPTGYTADVQSGDVTDFPDFAMNCARAFGALIMMRDAPSDEIPDRFEPSDFNLKRKDQAETELARLNGMTEDEVKTARDFEEAERIADRKYRNDMKSEQEYRYKAMLAKVERWVPPTPDHIEMKKFMRDQLSKSIEFDCSPSTWNEQPLPPAKEWHEAQVRQAQIDIDYYADRHREEVERTENRNKWLADLRSSFNK